MNSVVEGDRVRHEIQLPTDLWKLIRYGIISSDIREDNSRGLGFQVGDVVAYRNNTLGDDRVSSRVITWVSKSAGLVPGWVMLSFGRHGTDLTLDVESPGVNRVLECGPTTDSGRDQATTTQVDVAPPRV